MHNAALGALGLDWVYVPFPVEPARVGQAVNGLRALGVAGANVTIPHKTAVLAHCDIIEPAAERCGSANTLIVDDGRIVATSTDGEGVAAGLDVSGATCLVLGAGGASRPVVVALADAGAATVLVAARRGEAADALATDLASVAKPCSVRALAEWPPSAATDVIVNATPVKDQALVMPTPEHQVVDLAYHSNGVPTALIAAAHEAGCRRVIDGLEFLVRQGAVSFERWTGRAAPIDVMNAAVRGAGADAGGG